MSQALRLFVDILQQYSEDHSQDLRDTMGDLQNAETLLERASIVEDLANATWMVVRDRGANLAPSGHVYFVGRPYDDGDIRLIIIHGTRVILNELWPSRGTTKDWFGLLTDLAQVFRANAMSYPDESAAVLPGVR